MTDNLLGTDVVRRCVKTDKAGEGADCGQPRDQDNFERADMEERSSTHGLYTNRLEKSSVPGELRADLVERSSTHGIYANRLEKFRTGGVKG